MKKGVSIGLTVVFIIVLFLGLVSVLSFMGMGILDPVLKFFGITGVPIIDPSELPNYPVINTTFEKISNGNYTVRWTIEEVPDDPRWTALVLKTHVMTLSEGILTQELLPFGQQYKQISGTPPIFYIMNFTLDVKHGGIVLSSEGNCKPQCVPDNGVSGPGAWYDFCMNTVVPLKNVANCPAGYPIDYDIAPITEYFTIDPPYGCYEGIEPAEGWYNITCLELQSLFPADPSCVSIQCRSYKITNNVSRADPCNLGMYAVYYERNSNNMAIFEQELKTPTQNTSINWFTNFDFIEGDSDTSEDLLEGFSEVDYVSKWQSSDQNYYGSAEGIAGGGAPVVIGSFNLDKGKPYFASLSGGPPNSSMFLSYAGVVPSPVTFTIRKTADNDVNYINLPLNTTIDKLSDLCSVLIGEGIFESESSITKWDSLTQRSNSSDSCDGIYGDWDLEPGRVYLIHSNVTDQEWTPN